jgi:hypothetical protein
MQWNLLIYTYCTRYGHNPPCSSHCRTNFRIDSDYASHILSLAYRNSLIGASSLVLSSRRRSQSFESPYCVSRVSSCHKIWWLIDLTVWLISHESFATVPYRAYKRTVRTYVFGEWFVTNESISHQILKCFVGLTWHVRYEYEYVWNAKLQLTFSTIHHPSPITSVFWHILRVFTCCQQPIENEVGGNQRVPTFHLCYCLYFCGDCWSHCCIEE